MLPRILLAVCLLSAAPAFAQLDPFSKPQPDSNPLASPTLSPGQIVLYKLEADFAADVAHGGGKAFAAWFAEDAIELPNGKAPVEGRRAIDAGANWDAVVYQLTWKPDGARMDPGGNSGFTWGHYAGRSHDAQGQPVVREGRYITVWKKVDGQWKVALDASTDDAPTAECCSLPKP
jgi:ketosteroid isomerase-like protein